MGWRARNGKFHCLRESSQAFSNYVSPRFQRNRKLTRETPEVAGRILGGWGLVRVKKRKLGKSGIEIPEIGMGCWAIGGVGYGSVSEADAFEALQAAWEGGVRFFDTADAYGEGESERRVGSFLKTKKRDAFFIATKAGWDFYPSAFWKGTSGQATATGHKKNFDPDYLRFACEQSLQRLGMNCVDLYQLHNPSIEVLKTGKAFEVLQQLKKDGKIRLIGISVHTVSEALWVLENFPVDSIQVIYNILDQRMRHEVFPLALQKGVAVIVREPLASGMLAGKYSSTAVFEKNDHRRRFSKEKLDVDCQKIEKIKNILFPRSADAHDDSGAGAISKVSLVQVALQFALAEKAVSVVIPGAKNKQQSSHNVVSCSSDPLRKETVVLLKGLFDSELLFKKGLLPADK